MTREEWHEYYLKNKDKFTDSVQEALKDKNKIYIKNSESYTVGSKTLTTSKIEEKMFEKGIDSY